MEERRLLTLAEDGQRAIERRIETLRRDLGASGIILLDQSGQLMAESGRHGDLDINTFLALLANAMSASNEVVHMLRDEAAFDLHFHEGRNYDMYTARINDQVFLTLILERQGVSSSRVGMVWIYLKRAVTDLRNLVSSAMVRSGSGMSDELKGAVSESLEQALDLLDGDFLMPQERAKPPTQGPESKPGKTPAAPSNPKKPPEEAADAKRVISYDEARALGLIDLDDDPASSADAPDGTD